MKISFLGTSDGYPEKDRYCSCTVVTVGGKHYVIDAGLALYSALMHNDMHPKDVAAIFITHMHGDHASGLPEFVDLMVWGGRDKLEPAIYMPTVQGKIGLLAFVESMDSGREPEITVYREGHVFEDENVKVTAFRTAHTNASFGFLFEAEGKKIYFSGDFAGDFHDLPDFLFSDYTDLVVCESAHNVLYEHADKLNNFRTDKIIINHIAIGHSKSDFDTCKPLIKDKEFVFSFDGMTTEI